MVRGIIGALAVGMLAMLWAGSPAQSQSQPRIALVIGNANYAKGALKTPLVDGGLIAETLNSAGFEIVEGADVGQGDLRRIFRDFLAKVEAAGPDAIAFVYFSGYGLSFEGENFLAPVDVKLDRESDIPLDAVRLNDLMRPLAAMPGRAKVVVMDAARQHPFAMADARLATGLVAIEPSPGMLISYSSAPGTVAEDGQDAYGPFAVAISEMMREPGLDLDAAFTRIRIRTHQTTQGRQTPWHVSALGAPAAIVPAAAPTAPASAGAPPFAAPVHARRPVRPMRDVGMDEAYALAIEQDSLPAYSEFVQVYPQSAYAPRVWAIIRARREALAWMRAVEFNTPESYWTYLRRYPDGMYAEDARRRLRRLAALLEPPPAFAAVDFVGVPEPLIGEPLAYVAIYPPAPPPPLLLIEPVPTFYLHLPPPTPRPGFLAISATLPVASPFIRRPPRPFADPRAVKPAVFTPVKPAPLVSPRLPPPAGVHVRPGGPVQPTVPGRLAPQKPASIAATPAKPPSGKPDPALMKKQQALGAAGPGAGRASPALDRTKLAPNQPSLGARGGPPPGARTATPPQGRARTMPLQNQSPPRAMSTQPRPAASPAIRPAPPAASARSAPPPVARSAPPPPRAISRQPQTPVMARPVAPAPARSAPSARRCTVVNGKQVCR